MLISLIQKYKINYKIKKMEMVEEDPIVRASESAYRYQKRLILMKVSSERFDSSLAAVDQA